MPSMEFTEDGEQGLSVTMLHMSSLDNIICGNTRKFRFP